MTLENFGIQVNRRSVDKRKNNNGFKLIDICKNDNLTNLNGRFGKDKSIGNATFRGISVIDYVISSVGGLKRLDDFDITELDKLYSDGHALLSFNIRANASIPLCQRTQQRPPKYLYGMKVKYKHFRITWILINYSRSQTGLLKIQLIKILIKIHLILSLTKYPKYMLIVQPPVLNLDLETPVFVKSGKINIGSDLPFIMQENL